jgi:CDGSH-type Zn-finger protein
MVDERGDVRLVDTRMALCRCGLSANKPHCDNAHRDAGFREQGRLSEPQRVEDPGSEATKLRVILRENGPIELSGPFGISSSDRQTTIAGTRTKLCRCGQSGAKPFCDGTHKRVGFKTG